MTSINKPSRPTFLKKGDLLRAIDDFVLFYFVGNDDFYTIPMDEYITVVSDPMECMSTPKGYCASSKSPNIEPADFWTLKFEAIHRETIIRVDLPLDAFHENFEKILIER